MFTKRDLFWSVKGQYPDAKIGQSLADYKEAVSKVLGAKFDLSDDVLANNVKFKLFVRMFCEAISKLLKKFSKNYFAMVNSEAHTVFFSKEITVESLTVQPGPPLISNNKVTQTRKNDFEAGLEVLTVSHKSQTPKSWIPQSWKPTQANCDAADDDDTCDAFIAGDAFIDGDAIVDAGEAGDTEPPIKIRKVGTRQTQRDAKDLRAEVKSSEVCTYL